MQANKPLTRQDVVDNYLRLLEDTKLTPADVWLSSGSALIIHGLRETTLDLDGGCSKRTIRKIGELFDKDPVPKGPKEGYIEHCLLLPLDAYWMDLHSEDSTRADDLEVIDGVAVYTLERCLRQKQILLQRLNRDKDRADIENIRKRMRELGN